MASRKMQEILAKHEAAQRRLEQQEAEQDANNTSNIDNNEPEPSNDHQPETSQPKDDQPDASNEDGDSNDAEDVDDSSDADDSDRQDKSNDNDRQNPSSQTDEPIDYRNKFERLRGKQSAIEKEKVEMARENERLKLQLELMQKQGQAGGNSTGHSAIDQPKASKTDTPNSNQAVTNQAVTEQDVEDYLEAELGDEWTFADDSSKQSMRFMAKQTLDLRRQIEQAQLKPQTGQANKSADIDKIVAQKLAQRDKEKQLNQFNREMDGFVKTHDPDTDFIALINEEAFDAYLSDNRVANAMFVEASRKPDADSVQLMKDVVAGYLGKAALPKVGKPKADTPKVTSNPSPKPAAKKQAVSQDKIDWAFNNLNRPKHRKKAAGILAKAEEAGLI